MKVPSGDGLFVAFAGLFSCPCIALRNQLVERRALLGNSIRDPLFVLTARRGGGLFDQLTEIVAQHSDAIVKFRKRKIVRHRHVSHFMATHWPPLTRVP
jgi:hypothetical protein